MISSPFCLGGNVITNAMTTGQLRLMAKMMQQALLDDDFRCGLSDDELEEAQSLINMFLDPELDTFPRDMVHGFCL